MKCVFTGSIISPQIDDLLQFVQNTAALDKRPERVAELLATDPAYKAILQKVNVVLHPVENPDSFGWPAAKSTGDRKPCRPT